MISLAFWVAGLITTSAPKARASARRSGTRSITTSFLGVLSLATCTMPRPSGPAPAMTTTSSSWISPRFTVWMAQAMGSIMAASLSEMPSGILCTRAVAGRRMKSAMPPSATMRWKPKMLCTSHMWYLPEVQ